MFRTAINGKAVVLFINGIANFLRIIKDDVPSNVKVFHGDARIFLEKLTDNLLDNVYILFPDPWKKVRHSKKRIINHQTLELISKKMKNGSKLTIATDHVGYSEVIVSVLNESSFFDLQGGSYKR